MWLSSGCAVVGVVGLLDQAADLGRQFVQRLRVGHALCEGDLRVRCAAVVAVEADQRIVRRTGWLGSFLLGASQILALLPGISRDGTVMVAGMFRGLSRQDAARFSFLLSAPVILAAGLLKVPDLTGPLGAGIRGPILFGSLLSGVSAFFALRFLVRYFSDPKRTLTPFAIYCLAAGAGAFIYLAIR
mgnify:CR=1 FL=1